MTVCDPTSAHHYAGAIEVHDLADLAVILDPNVHIAIWHRPVDAGIVQLLERPEFRLWGPSRCIAHGSDATLGQQIADLIPDAAAKVDPEGAAALAADAHTLCEAFADLLAADELMVSFEQAHGATCPRFHVDLVGIRMLVTYRGPGTEWLPNEHVDRNWLGEAGMDRPDDQNGVMRPGAEVQQAPTFSVVLLKGETWPGADGFGAVHRSPATTNTTRTLLRVDMLSQLPIEDSNGR